MPDEKATQRKRPQLSMRTRMVGNALIMYVVLFGLLAVWVYNQGVPILINAASTGQSGIILPPDVNNIMIAAAQAKMQIMIPIVFFIGLILISGFLFVSVNTMTSTLRQLTEYAKKIANADYSPPQIRQGPLFDDEITTLTHVFMQMVAKIREREEGLKTQVRELQISIDEVKRAHQVEEITNSEFFNRLKADAQTMRSRHHNIAESDGATE